MVWWLLCALKGRPVATSDESLVLQTLSELGHNFINTHRQVSAMEAKFGLSYRFLFTNL